MGLVIKFVQNSFISPALVAIAPKNNLPCYHPSALNVTVVCMCNSVCVIKYICNYIQQDTCSLSSPSNLLPVLSVSSGTLKITLAIVFTKAEMVWLFDVKWWNFG